MNLQQAIIELYRRASTSIPEDVENSLEISLKKEKDGSLANYSLSNMIKNIELSRDKSLPMCQDTGTPIFYIKVPIGISNKSLAQTVINATRTATKEIPLRPNAVDVLSEKNTGDNIGFNDDKRDIHQPLIYFEQWDNDCIRIDLMLKGGGSENIGMTYKLPNKELKADRDIEGIKKCILDAVFKAQGKGCPPYIIGAAIGGSKDQLAIESKKQLLRRIDDINEDKTLAKLEHELRNKINASGIGPLGLGGKTTALAVKIKSMHRHPASFFIDISFMCWACRRYSLIYNKGEAIFS